MLQAWQCPACQAVIHYDDYDRARTGAIFPYRKCGLPLIIDRKADHLVAAKKRPTKPTR